MLHDILLVAMISCWFIVPIYCNVGKLDIYYITFHMPDLRWQITSVYDCYNSLVVTILYWYTSCRWWYNKSHDSMLIQSKLKSSQLNCMHHNCSCLVAHPHIISNVGLTHKKNKIELLHTCRLWIFLPSHLTPASSEWRQLCTKIGLLKHSSSLLALKVQATSSK